MFTLCVAPISLQFFVLLSSFPSHFQLMQYMNSGGPNYEQPVNDVKEPQVVRRSTRIRMMAGMLPYISYARRKAYFVGKVRFRSG
jgi:hypothetical protein